MLTKDFHFDLPEELIAQAPPPERGISRMMVLDRASGTIEHKLISDICGCLRPNDLLVMNDTKVFNARAFGTWIDSPGKVEVLFIEPADDSSGWFALCKSSRPMRQGAELLLADGKIHARVAGKTSDGRVALDVKCDGDFFDILAQHGAVPVPPYIRRERGDEAAAKLDASRYQTIYARETGAVAAPTAGLHFSQELLAKIKAAGVAETFLTLHVGPGTFRPVKTDSIEEHAMDPERYEIPQSAADAVAAAKRAGGRVVAVGSTSVRTLETSAGASADGLVRAGRGRSSIFIHPPYEFKTVDAMLTNFHLPCSTLIMMVSALAGRDFILRAYKEAVERRYRFFSYGDCMLIV